MVSRRSTLLLLIGLVIATASVIGQNPTPHGVEGRVYRSDGTTQAPSGTAFLVNDTATRDYVAGRTQPPGGPGHYSVSIDGNDNDVTFVLAWNNTHYGNSTFLLIGDMSNRDVILNQTRPSETNVTIIIPLNDTLVALGSIFNVTANVTLIGGSVGTGCHVNLTFGANPLVFAIQSSVDVVLGSLSIGQTVLANWTVYANLTGVANATAIAACSSDAFLFDGVNSYTVHNLTSNDTQGPIVRLLSPLNNTLNTTHRIQTFVYNVTDPSVVSNCSMILNGAIVMTNQTITENRLQNFTLQLPSANYTWSVNCTDEFGNVGASDQFNLTLNVSAITYGSFSIDDPILLSAGNYTTVWCNATLNGSRTINATLYDTSVAASGSVDNNSRYINNTCANNAGNYSCSFNVLYHANNGSWSCNLTGIAYDGFYNSTNLSTSLAPLTAIDITPSLINYGLVAAGNLSSLIPINVTNAGNVRLDLNMYAYGVSENDSIALDCVGRIIPIENQRVNFNASASFLSMTGVSANSTEPTFLALGLPKRITNPAVNQSYWRLLAPNGSRANCSGSVVFTAILS